MTAEALGVVFQMRAVIDPGTISILGAVAISLGTAACTVLAFISLAILWQFPTPFGYVLSINPFVLFFSIFTVLVVGPRALTQSPMLRMQFRSQFIIILNQGVVAICYPFFSAVFNRLSGIQQTAFVFVLPLIKFFAKQNIANAAKSYHEYVGPVVVFSVDLFNIYYVAICMQASKSLVTTAIIMAADSCHVILALRAILKGKGNAQVYQKSVEPSIESVTHYLRDLPVLLRKTSREDEKAQRSHRHFRLFAPFSAATFD
ncbi:Sister chromatid cohesion protein 2 [Phytophthora pseudosyringae]|uniref:Sister chromatid cohesion protein 2 n=1 Tax=Phytophthora pseudosyringae TaxID=221518 RepID=A0A8T1W455_9STRA|nr:Sister chromatid cohesion protein 2 [Phytophthora pseudosyringae]